ncbi:hypothetical protein BCR32DRAFT_269921, partial [Anaeromyces robustus]
MNQNYNYYQQNLAVSQHKNKSLIDVLLKIEKKYNFDFSFFKDKIQREFYKSVTAFQDEFLVYMQKINNNNNNDMKKTFSELINYEISLIQQNKEQFKEYNKKYDEHLYNTQNKMYYHQAQSMNQGLPSNMNQPYTNNNEPNRLNDNKSKNVYSKKSIPSVPSIGRILPLSGVNPLNQNNNGHNNNKIFKTASYTKYGPFTSFGPAYDLSESTLSTLEASTLEPYLYNTDNEEISNNQNKEKDNSSLNDIHSDSSLEKDKTLEINENETEDWEKMGINLENVCQNFNISYIKKDELNSKDNRSLDEKIAEISQLLKQLFEYQENRKNRSYYQTEISVDEQELAYKIESRLNSMIKDIPPSQLISKSNIKYAMNNIQHYEPWYQGVLTYDNTSTGSHSSMNRYSRH